MPDSDRPGFTEIALRLSLVLVAFIILWRVEEPTLLELPTIQIGAVEPQQGPVLPAGLLFGLAGRPLSGWTYRPGLPVVLGVFPAIIVAVQLLGRIGYFLVSDFPLRISAILLGVAIAQGVVSSDEKTPDG